MKRLGKWKSIEIDLMKSSATAFRSCCGWRWFSAGWGFASVFAVALLVGGIYLIATDHPSGGYALAGASVLAGIVVITLVMVVAVRFAEGKRKVE